MGVQVSTTAGISHPRCTDRDSAGRLWVIVSSGQLRGSTDNGASWANYSSAFTAQCSMYIDSGDFMHVTCDVANEIHYKRGTWTGSDWSWSSEKTIEAVNTGVPPGKVVAHVEGTGWRVHCVYDWYNGATAFRAHWSHFTVSSGGVFGAVTTVVLPAGNAQNSDTDMDFRHADGSKAVATQPDLYFMYGKNTSEHLAFKKYTNTGAGTWSTGSEITIDSSDGCAGPSLAWDNVNSRVYMSYRRNGTRTVDRVVYRDGADTTTTQIDAPASPGGNLNGTIMCLSGSVHLVSHAMTSQDLYRVVYSGSAWGSWTLLEGVTTAGSNQVAAMPRTGGFIYAMYEDDPAAYVSLISQLHALGVTMQGVATLTPAQLGVRYGIGATMQGVAGLTPTLQGRFGFAVVMQAVARLTAGIEGVPFHDFTVYDAYLESSIRSEGLLFFDEQKPETVSRKLTPTRQDVGNNPEEVRPEFGDMFAQGDFSHGAGQRYFHQAGRDPKKYWYSEGFDISEPGKLTHLRAIAEARDSTTIGRVEQVGDLPFVVNGQRVDRGNGSWPGTWTAEDPSAADPDQNVLDICAEGARLYAALNVGTASVRIRDSAGVWTHFQVGGVDLVVGTATRLAWLMSRLMVIGGTNARSIYEVAASATPTAIETLPEGWIFADLFEAEGFIHATAVNANAGLSRVHHYGLNTTSTAIEKKSSTPFPQGQLIYTGCGFPGLAFLAGGVRNSSGGYDPILYRAAVGQDLGALQYEEIRQETGAGVSDLSVRACIPMGETILAGWSLGSGAYGGARDGIAVYHIGRNAFAHHLRKTASGGALRVAGIMPYQGRVLISITGDGLYYEDLTTYFTTAQLVTSAADWNNAGLKVWDQIEISHDALAANHAIAVAYTTETFETATWNTVFTSDLEGATRQDGRLSNVKARQFALRITSTATAAATPVFLAYNVRSLPSPVNAEFQLTRFIRLLGKDRKDEDAPFVFNDPDDMLAFLQDSIYQFVNFYESNASWIAWLEDVSTVEPEQPFYDLTHGEALKDAFVVRLQMTGTR
jgi:hypothetical protein